MSIFFINNTLEIDCEKCDHADTYHGRLAKAWAEAEAAGWRVWKDKAGKSCHACPACVEAGRLA